jgi:hypothetical protein
MTTLKDFKPITKLLDEIRETLLEDVSGECCIKNTPEAQKLYLLIQLAIDPNNEDEWQDNLQETFSKEYILFYNFDIIEYLIRSINNGG